MQILQGIGASPGIAIGPAFVINEQKPLAARQYVEKSEIEKEVARYHEALEKTEKDIDALQNKVSLQLGAEYSQFLAIHHALLKDPSLVETTENKIRKEQMSAENAILSTAREANAGFEKIQDDFFKERRNDIFDVVKRLFIKLSGKEHNFHLEEIKTPSIILAHNLFPSDTFTLKEKQVIAFATDIGGKTSHTALLAQSLELPAVVGLSNAVSQVKQGDIVIVDGEKGALIISPDADTLAAYKQRQREIAKEEQLLKTVNALPAVTTDGKKINLFINYDPRRDSKQQKFLKTDGLGLLRTEFLFLEREQPPSEKEQIDVYTETAKKFGERPVTIRLADLGGDKMPLSALAEAEQEENPFMGLRGVRFLLKYPELMRTQIRAVIKTASQVDAKIKMLVPMVAAIEEIKAVKQVFNDELKACEVLACTPRHPILFGVMIEVPSVAIAIDTVLSRVDFISIGSNDLIQYIVAVDRVNQEVASLYNPYHPAVIRIIGSIIQTAVKKNKEVSLCGELASDPDFVPMLIGLGLDNLSASSGMYLRIKSRIRNLSYDRCSNLAQTAVLMDSSEEIKKLSVNVLDENS